MFRPLRLLRIAAATALLASGAQASATYLFWLPPSFAGAPVTGEEPGLGLPMPKATPKEIQAHLLWNLRAGLNVAALQCQFDSALMTVRNYNDILRQHSRELTDAYSSISGYFKRTGGKTWQKQLDQYTTKTYNGFSTLHAQYGFCETAASIGREALTRKRGEFILTARGRMREFRNSLIPAGDRLYQTRPVLQERWLPSMRKECWDGKNLYREKKCGALPV